MLTVLQIINLLLLACVVELEVYYEIAVSLNMHTMKLNIS